MNTEEPQLDPTDHHPCLIHKQNKCCVLSARMGSPWLWTKHKATTELHKHVLDFGADLRGGPKGAAGLGAEAVAGAAAACKGFSASAGAPAQTL